MIIPKTTDEHPILMCPPMVLATLDGRKTVTRRLDRRWLRAQKGQRLWIRENCYRRMERRGRRPPKPECYYVAGDAPIVDRQGNRLSWWYSKRSCPSSHMPRRVCRILLEVTEDARLEPLQAITAAEVQAEGLVVEDHDWDYFYLGYDPDYWDCPDCGGDGRVEWADHPELWGEDCTGLENHLVACPGCPRIERDKNEAIHRWKFAGLWDTLGREDGQHWVDEPDVVRLAFAIAEVIPEPKTKGRNQ